MSITEQYNQELYHYGVKGMKWGVRKAYKQRDNIVRKHDKYVDKYQKAKSKGQVKKAAKYESKAWKERAKFEITQQKIRDLDPERTKKAEDFVKQLMSESQGKTTSPTTSASGSTKGRKRYFEMNEVERQRFDDNYTKKRKQLIEQYRAATDDVEKARIEKKVNKLEIDYLDEVEQDW